LASGQTQAPQSGCLADALHDRTDYPADDRFQRPSILNESMDIRNIISADTGAIEQKVLDTISMLTNPPYVRPSHAESVCNSNFLVVN
jgi:hypothetical protein